LCIKAKYDVMRREHLGLRLQRRHLQQSAAMTGLHVDQLLEDGQNPGVEHQPCPVSSTGRQATTATATPAASVPPQQSAGDAFRTSVVYLRVFSFYPGYVETRFRRMVISSPVSFLNSGTSRSTQGGHNWRIDRGVQLAYIIINSL
jgi:hypothetical protein